MAMWYLSYISDCESCQFFMSSGGYLKVLVPLEAKTLRRAKTEATKKWQQLVSNRSFSSPKVTYQESISC